MPRQLSGLGTNVHAMAIGMGLRARAMLRQTALAVGAATSLGDAFAMSTLLALTAVSVKPAGMGLRARAMRV